MDYSEEKDQYFQKEGWYESAWELEYTSKIENVQYWHELPSLPISEPDEIRKSIWDEPMDN